MKCEKCGSKLSIPPIIPNMDKIYKNFSINPRYWCEKCKRKDIRSLTDEDFKKWKELNKIEG